MFLAACQPAAATFETGYPDPGHWRRPLPPPPGSGFQALPRRRYMFLRKRPRHPMKVPAMANWSSRMIFRIDSAWLTGAYPGGNVAYGADTLNLAVAVPNGSLTSYRKDTYFSDLYWEITVAANLCTPSDIYGLIFWSENEQNYHELAFNCSGEFSMDKVNSGYRSQLLDWTASSQVPRGGLSPFRVGLWVGKGPRPYLPE